MLEIIYIILIFGLTVFVHELGHFLAAKAIGVRVEKFSIGWGKKMVSFKYGETEYMLSWLLFLGGFVKVSGENPDELDVNDKKAFLNQTVPKKILLAASGVTMNFLFAIILMWIVFLAGTDTLKPVVGEAKTGYPAYEAGIKRGDIITAVNEKKIKYWNELTEEIKNAGTGETKITVLRNGTEKVFTVIPKIDEVEDVLKDKIKRPFIGIVPLAFIPVVDSLRDNFPAIKAGVKKGDLITSINGTGIEFWPDVKEAILASKGREVELTVKRGKKELIFKMKPVLEEYETEDGGKESEYIIGIQPKSNTVKERYGPVAAMSKAVERTLFFTDLTMKAIYKMIMRKIEPDVAGPIGVMHITYKVAKTGFVNLLFIFVIININLALVNILPIVPLDGGLILIFLIESIIKRSVPLKVQEVLMQAGWMFIVFLLIFFTYKDIIRIISGKGF